MTLQTSMVFGEMRFDRDNSPLITKWITLLSLEEEPVKIVIEHKSGYAGIKLHFDNYLNSWVVTNNGLDDYWILHKLGYLWYWKKMGIIEKQKTTWRDKDAIYCLVESCIMDNIVFYYFCNMDRGFNDFWIDFTVKEGERWYNGASWYKELPNMLYQYVVNYLNYFYVLPGDLQNKLTLYILVELNKRRLEILEKCQNNNVLFTNREFILLHKLLRKFNLVLGVKNYRSIVQYIFQLYDIFSRLVLE